MTELETALYNLVTKYGVSVLVIACLTILFIGILKYFNVFSKVEKDNRKPIYFVLNYAFVFAASAIYYAIFKLSFADYVAYAFVVGSVVNLLYPLYENLKIRDLFTIIGNFIVKTVAKKQVETETAKIKEETTKTEEVITEETTPVIEETKPVETPPEERVI